MVARVPKDPVITITQFRALLSEHDTQREHDCLGMPCPDHVADHERIALLMPYLEASKKADDAKANFWNTLFDLFGLEKMQARRAFWIGFILAALALFVGWHRALTIVSRWFG